MNEVTIRSITVVKGRERYCILFLPERVNDVYRLLGRWASNKELSFSWYDAARVAVQLQLQEQDQAERAA